MKNLLICLSLFLSLNGFADSLGKVPIQTVFLSYTSTNVTTSAWTQIVASMPSATTYAEIFDSSGQVMKLGQGASGSEIDFPYIIFPGGNGQTPLKVGNAKRIVAKALSANATSGYLLINFYQ